MLHDKKNPKWLLAASTFFYCLIGIEIIIMITPFALYFYSVYGPILNVLSSTPMTSWSTEFFLPHMVFLDDPLILFISYLQILMVIGLILFLTAAVPLYWGRFTNKGVVQASFYAKIRHPQYLFLAISGFGLLLYWPRFIIVVMYITMLFVYYLLARNEEWRMKKEQRRLYEKYMQQTPMFLPGEPGAKIYSLLFGWIKPKWFGLLVLYLVTLSLSLLLALGVRSYTVEHIPTFQKGQITLVPVFSRPEAEVDEIYQKVLESEKAASVLAQKEGPNMGYILPSDFFLTALVTDEDRRFSDDILERFPEIIEWHKYKFRGGLRKFFKIFYNFIRTLGTVETDFDIERLVFMRVTDGDGHAVSPDDLFRIGMRRRPVLIVDLDAYSHEILSVIKTSENHKWGEMPMPTF